MKLGRVVLAGGSGYLGGVLADYYRDKADEIIILSRSAHASNGKIQWVEWDGRTKGPWTSALEGCDLLINLCGKNVNCRYTEKNKAEIFRSRLEPTKLLGEVVAELRQPPKVWINMASATIFRHAEDRPQDEVHGEIGQGFSVEVCKAWEATFAAATAPSTKKIVLRVAIAFGKKDGVIPRLWRMTRLGFGGKQGNGHQFVSWIHEQDLARMTEWVYLHGKDGGVYNAVAPQVIRNSDLMRLVRKRLHMPFGLPAPSWFLDIGAVIIGTETELILKSRWVYPQRLLDEGFQFTYPDAESALQDIL